MKDYEDFLDRMGSFDMSFESSRDDDHISHHGIKGQKWGVRRFQNPDGTRTRLGKARYKEMNDYKSDVSQKTLKKDFDKLMKYEKEHELELGTDSDLRAKHMAKFDSTLIKHGEIVTEKMIEKFGQQDYEAFKKKQDRQNAATLYTVMGIAAAAHAIPVVLIAKARKGRGK